MTMFKRASVVVCLGVIGSFGAGAVRAQTASELLQQATTVTLFETGHGAHFNYSQTPQNLATIQALNAAIAGQFATFPLGSSAGGFTFTSDPASGVASRNSDTFGPQFGERALTIGKGRFNVGVQYLHSGYDSINGIDLQDGALTFQLTHEDTFPPGVPDPYFEGDVITSNTEVDLTLDTVLLMGTWGVTDRIDVAAVLPVVRTDMTVTSLQTIQRLATPGEGLHLFDPSQESDEFHFLSDSQGIREQSASATGLGDVMFRGKYSFAKPKSVFGIAAALDLRLPTGSEEDLAGIGVAQARGYAIGSWNLGRFSPHFNLGYTASFGDSDLGDVPDEVNYLAGCEFEVHPRVSLLADLIGRYLIDTPVVSVGPQAFVADPNGGGNPVSTTLNQMTSDAGDLNILQGTAGVKINPGGNWLISLGALVPITDDGLNNDVLIFAGFDYNF
jgi:hypothetical protein